MKRATFFAAIAISCFLLGCASTPEQLAAEATRREAEDQRDAAEQRRNAERELREKFARYSTAELKLMDLRYKELRQTSGRDLNVSTNPYQRKLWGDSDTENTKRLLEIERELLRRWNAGDKEAFLPEFDNAVALPAK